MYNGQKNCSHQIGQIKQNKIIASDYSRPRIGSYCQYKQEKLSANSMTPLSFQKQDFANIKRSSLGFYDHNRISNSDLQSRLQKYSSKEFHSNQVNTIKNSHRDSNLNFTSKNRDGQYRTLPKNYDTERFYQTYDSFHDHDRYPSDGLLKKDSKRINKYSNQNYQSQPKYEKVYEQNSFASEQSIGAKYYRKDHINMKYQDKRNEKSTINQNEGKKQLNDLYFQSYRQNILQTQKFQDLGNQKSYLKAEKPHYELDQNRRNQRNFTINQRQREKTQTLNKYFQQVETSNHLPFRTYNREKNTIFTNENDIEQKKNNVMRQVKSYELQNDEKIVGTPNRLKYNEDQKLEKNLSNSRRDHLISKSKILRQKMNELSADKKFVGSSNFQYDENKDQSYQERLQRLKNNKNRVYESPFKQTIKSSSNLPMRYSNNTQSDQIEKSNKLQKKELKTQMFYENRENLNEQSKHDSMVQGYGPKNDCMDRISLLNNKINEKISSIISSYGRPSH